jgi:hypothetical protein
MRFRKLKTQNTLLASVVWPLTNSDPTQQDRPSLLSPPSLIHTLMSQRKVELTSTIRTSQESSTLILSLFALDSFCREAPGRRHARYDEPTYPIGHGGEPCRSTAKPPWCE